MKMHFSAVAVLLLGLFAVSTAGKDLTSDAFLQNCVVAHNKYRALHGAPPVKLSAAATTHAKKWASYLADSGRFDHSKDRNGKMGENLAGLTTGGMCDGAVKMWYDEIKDYNFASPGFNGKTGHFTQVVWKESTEIGCGVASSSKLPYDIVVCNYMPPGNMVNAGFFERNVLPPK